MSQQQQVALIQQMAQLQLMNGMQQQQQQQQQPKPSSKYIAVHFLDSNSLATKPHHFGFDLKEELDTYSYGSLK